MKVGLLVIGLTLGLIVLGIVYGLVVLAIRSLIQWKD